MKRGQQMNYQAILNKTQKKLEDIQLALNESCIVAITDSAGVIQFANDKFCEISKYSREELIGSNQSIVNSGHHSKAFMKEFWQTIGSGMVWRGEFRNKAKDGTLYWVNTTVVPFLYENGKPYQYIAIRQDITKRKEYEENMKLMAYYDPLTSLPNRNLLTKWFSELPHKNRETLAVLFIDFDRFKSINDNFGHITGDLLLKEVAKRLSNCLRKTDFVSRQGGDEFIAILNDIEEKEEVVTIVNKISKQLSLPYEIKNDQLFTSSSIGISMSSVHGDQCDCHDFIETLITQADNAMYLAKKQGGNTYCFSTPALNSERERFYKMEYELKQALEKEQFSVVYQPLFNLSTQNIVGAEALLRWKNPRIGNVSPAEFIPVLEELGYIIPVGEWVLKTVCTQMVEWQRQGFMLSRVAINVSPVQFRHKDFVCNLESILKETGLDSNLLELEITEGTILNIVDATRILSDLKKLGVKVSIDDFGTGYSSLSYLKKLPIDTLKIDKSFIDDLDTDGEIIVNTIIHMGKNLNFNVLAEGIETEDQLDYLKLQECHEGQGYYFSKPLAGKELFKLNPALVYEVI
jgi:diguanylate cyclase (GGDEF)-like protein/PAS domain S-box-containing protein